MVLQVEPFVNCLEDIQSRVPEKKSLRRKVLMVTPEGRVYNQRLARDLAEHDHLLVLCGHYKGMDERVYHYVDEKISLGDYVLSGGELPAMILVDSVARLLPGAVSDFESVATDSHYNGLLGAPCYTRPREFRGMKVPDVLLSGNHRKIEEWRFLQSVERTLTLRPELLQTVEFTKEEIKILKKHRLLEKVKGVSNGYPSSSK